MIPFLWALVGALLSLMAYVAWEHLLLLRRPSGFFGEWRSSWQPTVNSGWHWVTENLIVRRRFGRVVLENSNNSAGYEWRGVGRIIDDRYISGQWKSLKPGSQSRGLFVLVMGFEGGYLVGFFFGEEKPGSKVTSGVVLGRTEQDVENAKKRLRTARPVLPTGPSHGEGAG
jgi:hypothetical protein